LGLKLHFDVPHTSHHTQIGIHHRQFHGVKLPILERFARQHIVSLGNAPVSPQNFNLQSGVVVSVIIGGVQDDFYLSDLRLHPATSQQEHTCCRRYKNTEPHDQSSKNLESAVPMTVKAFLPELASVVKKKLKK
jgi:hypothetical protein